MKKLTSNKNLISAIVFIASLSNVVFAGDAMGEVEGILKSILVILLGLGGAVCVGKLIHIGILYMTSSVVEKSNAKAAMLPWLIGTIVCFGAAWIGPWIIGLFSNGIAPNVLDIK